MGKAGGKENENKISVSLFSSQHFYIINIFATGLIQSIKKKPLRLFSFVCTTEGQKFLSALTSEFLFFSLYFLYEANIVNHHRLKTKETCLPHSKKYVCFNISQHTWLTYYAR